MNRDGIKNGHSDELFAEQVKLLYNNAPIAYSTTLINGAILIYVLRAHISAPILLAWYSCLLLVTVIRSIAVWQYKRIDPAHDDPPRWHIIYLIGAALAGIVWGSTAVVLFPINSISHQVFIAFVLAGMAAGGISVLAPRMEVCLAFLLPQLLPLTIRYLSFDTALQRAMGVMTLIFFVAISFSALNFHRSILTSLNLRFDKRTLEEEVIRRRHAEE